MSTIFPSRYSSCSTNIIFSVFWRSPLSTIFIIILYCLGYSRRY
nr:MAG TPA: hypothetical protein [Bacteriophage sp.]